MMMADLTVNSGSQIGRVMASVEDSIRLTMLVFEAERSGLPAQRQAAESLAPAVASAEKSIEALTPMLRPASEQEIATYLAMLLKAYPNIGKDDAKAFGRLLLEDVIDLKPAVGAMEAGCRDVRQTCKFLPSIAEVLEAVRKADASLRGAVGRWKALPALAEGLAKLIEEGEQREKLRAGRN